MKIEDSIVSDSDNLSRGLMPNRSYDANYLYIKQVRAGSVWTCIIFSIFSGRFSPRSYVSLFSVSKSRSQIYQAQAVHLRSQVSVPALIQIPPTIVPTQSLSFRNLVTPSSRDIQYFSPFTFDHGYRSDIGTPVSRLQWRWKTRMEIRLLPRNPSSILVLMHPRLILRQSEWVVEWQRFWHYPQ